MGSGEEATIADPLNFITEEHVAHQKLCDLLEEIADNLPDNVNSKNAQQAAQELKTVLPLHHRLEEEVLFPLLEKYAAPADNIYEILSRLAEEHVLDEDFAGEIVDILENLTNGTPPPDANMFGYMLRGFFENYRRHILWENSVVIALARRRLPVQAMEKLAQDIYELQKQHRDQSFSVSSPCNGNCDDCQSKINLNPDN